LVVCLFVGINPEKLNSTSCVVREVNPLGMVTHGQRHKPRACKDSGTNHVLFNLWLSLGRCQRRGFSPGAAVRHSQSAKVHTDWNHFKIQKFLLKIRLSWEVSGARLADPHSRRAPLAFSQSPYGFAPKAQVDGLARITWLTLQTTSNASSATKVASTPMPCMTC